MVSERVQRAQEAFERDLHEFFAEPSAAGTRGASKGNMNAFKQGKRSRRLSEAKRVERALAKAPAHAVSPEDEFKTAMRWSRTERAVLVIAVTKGRSRSTT